MLEIVILAVVQGIAEFLPVSSSGHLVILGALFGDLAESPTLEIILHAGTLGSILVVFWRRIIQLISQDRRVLPMIFIGTLPVVFVGLIVKTQYESVLRSPVLAGTMLLVTAVMLIILRRLTAKAGFYQGMSLTAAFVVGCFQALAILPGISRSGSTILGGRLMGLSNEDSVTFSFLLAIPAIFGATLLSIKDVYLQYHGGGQVDFPIGELALGASISFAVGIGALHWLIRWSRRDRLHWFAWWCFPAGIAAIAYFSI